MENRKYTKAIESNRLKPNYLSRGIFAFVYGGAICVIGQLLLYLYNSLLELDKEIAVSLMVVTLVFIASLLTGLGVYDKFGQKAGMGAVIPVTGFANAMTSAAIEYREEGYVLGVGANMFKLAGTVIVYGVVSAYFFGMIRYLFLEVIL